MPRHPWSLLRALARHADAGPLNGVPDADLLARFAKDRDPAAFELLVWRHGRMVLAVCRRVVRDPHRADDAFQATFLILARKAGSVRESAAGYLHRVARRVAVRAAKREAARLRREVGLSADPPARPDEPSDPLLRAVLDEEVDRLPDRLRLPVVLCYLEGRPTEEAAGLLGIPRGTVLSRLSAARATLAARLTRRGVTAPSTGLLVTGATDLSAEAVGRCVGAALEFVGKSVVAGSTAAGLAEGVMTATKLKVASIAAGCLLALTATVGTGVGVAVGQKTAEGTGHAASTGAAKNIPSQDSRPTNPSEDKIRSLEKAISNVDTHLGVAQFNTGGPAGDQEAGWRKWVVSLEGELRHAEDARRKEEAALKKFLAVVQSQPEVRERRQEHGTMQTHRLRKEHMPGIKSDDVDLANMRREDARLRTLLVAALRKAITDAESTAPLPPSLKEVDRDWLADTMVANTAAVHALLHREEHRLLAQLEWTRLQLYQAMANSPDNVTALKEVRRQLRRDLLLRQLQAEGVPLKELPVTGGANPPQSSTPSNDQFERVLVELAALRAEVRELAAKK